MRLNLIADQDGYGVKMSNAASVIVNTLKGGPSAKRADMLDVTYLVDVQYTLSPERYNYLREFIADYFEALTWFDVLLVIEPYIAKYPLRNYKAQIIPGSIALITADGLKYVVKMQLECYLDDIPLSSELYPIDDSYKINMRFALTSASMKISNHLYNFNENINTVFSLQNSSLKVTLKTYSNYAFESTAVSFNLISSSLRVLLRTYGNYPYESTAINLTLQSASLKVTLKTYDKWPKEQLSATFTLQASSLT